MACFAVPAAEAIIVTTAYFVAKRKEQKLQAPQLSGESALKTQETKITWSKRLSWLMGLLWGGVALLAFEHFWHGEIVAYPPFLSAMANPEDTSQMLHEMATVGVSMAALVTAFWGAICAFAQVKFKKVRSTVAKDEA